MFRFQGTPEWKFGNVDLPCGSVRYAAAGDGPAHLFLHGFLLGSRSYMGPLTEVAERGSRVIAPAMPGFATPARLRGRPSIDDYADWAIEFMSELGVDRFAVSGHSFGGGVALAAACAYPGRVERALLINPVGGAAFADRKGRLRHMSERRSLAWGRDLVRDMKGSKFGGLGRKCAGDACETVRRSHVRLVHLAGLARHADLVDKAYMLADHGTPRDLIYSRGDYVLSPASFDILANAMAVAPIVVEGAHSWLIENERDFERAVTPIMAEAFGDYLDTVDGINPHIYARVKHSLGTMSRDRVA